MIYFKRATEIAIAETDETALRLQDRGFERCDYAAFRADWQMRDAAALAGMREELARAVGGVETAPIKGPALELGKP